MYLALCRQCEATVLMTATSCRSCGQAINRKKDKIFVPAATIIIGWGVALVLMFIVGEIKGPAPIEEQEKALSRMTIQDCLREAELLVDFNKVSQRMAACQKMNDEFITKYHERP